MPYHFRPVMPDRAIGRYTVGGERLRTVGLTQSEQATLQGDYFYTWFHAGAISTTATSLIAGTANPQVGLNGVANPAIAGGASHFFGFRAPAGMNAAALRLRELKRMTGGELKYYVYTGVPEFADGRRITIWNENGLLAPAAMSQFHYFGTTAPSVTGALVRDMDILPSLGGGGGSTGGTFSREDSFRLLPLQSRFILEIQNPTNQPAEYTFWLKFAEVDLTLVE